MTFAIIMGALWLIASLLLSVYLSGMSRLRINFKAGFVLIGISFVFGLSLLVLAISMA